MPRTPYAELPEDAKERQRAYVRNSLKITRLRRIEVYASSPEILKKAQQAMPPGLSLNEFLSQLIDRIAHRQLVPAPPDTKKP